MCDWIEKWGERYEGFVEFEDDEEGEGRKSRDAGNKGRDKEKEKERKSKRLERYLTGMRENGGWFLGFSLFLERFAHSFFFFPIPCPLFVFPFHFS